MRNLTWFLTLVVGALLTFFVLLPLLGFVLMVIVVVAVLSVTAYFALPLLVRVPWFRKWIRVRERDVGRSDDVIDVEGREIPDEE